MLVALVVGHVGSIGHIGKFIRSGGYGRAIPQELNILWLVLKYVFLPAYGKLHAILSDVFPSVHFFRVFSCRLLPRHTKTLPWLGSINSQFWLFLRFAPLSAEVDSIFPGYYFSIMVVKFDFQSLKLISLFALKDIYVYGPSLLTNLPLKSLTLETTSENCQLEVMMIYQLVIQKNRGVMLLQARHFAGNKKGHLFPRPWTLLRSRPPIGTFACRSPGWEWRPWPNRLVTSSYARTSQYVHPLAIFLIQCTRTGTLWNCDVSHLLRPWDE